MAYTFIDSPSHTVPQIPSSTQYSQTAMQQPGFYIQNLQHRTPQTVNGYYSTAVNEQLMEQHIQLSTKTNSLPLNLARNFELSTHTLAKSV